MEPETKDQVTTGTPDTTGDTSATKEQAGTGQSETSTGEGTPTEKSYKIATPQGEREFKTMDELYEYASKVSPNFTKISQENAELRRKVEEREAKATQATQDAIAKNPLLENVDPNVRDAIVQIVQPVISEALKAKDLEAQKRAEDQAFAAELDNLEKEFPGGDGRPKFSKVEVLAAMREPTNRIYDPKVKFYEMYRQEIEDHLIKQALKDKSGGTKSERTGGTPPQKPEGKAASNFEEAARNAFERLRSS